MKKPVLLAPRSATREVLSEVDAAQMLQGGSWVRVAGTKPISKGAAWQRKYRQRCMEQGFRQFSVWLPESTFSALEIVKRPGESFAELIKRLLELPNSSDE